MMKLLKLLNNSSGNVEHLMQMVQHFFPYAQKQLGFHKPVMVSFQSDEENANKLLGKTGYYNPDEFSIAIYVDGRHPKDVLRSLSHELVHHAQNCNGDFDSTAELGPGYAQEDEKMRNAELDAYKRGNIIFRDFEDLIKKGDIAVEIDFEKAGEPNMSLKEWKNNELNILLLEKWGYKVQKEEQQIFAPNHYCAHHVRENVSGLEGRCVDHNWNERLQEVTAYEVDFGNNDIRTLRVEELTILEASLAEGHPGHPARKEDDWGKDPAAFTGTEKEEKKVASALRRGKGLEEQREDIGSKEHDDEEGNRPSMARKMDLDEQDEPDDKKKEKAGDRISASGRDELGSGKVDLSGTEDVARWASEQPPHDRFGKYPGHAEFTHKWPKGMKETLTLDEARDVATRIFEKLGERDNLSEGWKDAVKAITRPWRRAHAAGESVNIARGDGALSSYASGGGGKVVRGGAHGQRAKDYAAMGLDPSQAPVDVAVDMDAEERGAQRAARADAKGGGRVVPGGSQSDLAKAARRQGKDVSIAPEVAGLRQHFKAKREKEAAPRAKPAPQELEPGRSAAGAVNVRMPEGKSLNQEALVKKILERLRKETK